MRLCRPHPSNSPARPGQARTLAMRFRRHNIAQIDAMAPHWNDEDKLIAAAKQGRQQLEELFAHERGDAAQRQVKAGWTREENAEREIRS